MYSFDSKTTIQKFMLLSRSFLFTAIFIVTPLLMPNVKAQDIPSETINLPSVEERRLQVRIVETQEGIIEEKKALALKHKELDTLKTSIDDRLTAIDEKLAQMKQQKVQLEELLAKKDQAEKDKIKNLSKIYESMEPGKAAMAISGLDQQLAAELLANMRTRSAAQILDNLDNQQTTEISKLFLSLQPE
jgi:flagellar motility protein MotE (MotC chaperone)